MSQLLNFTTDKAALEFIMDFVGDCLTNESVPLQQRKALAKSRAEILDSIKITLSFANVVEGKEYRISQKVSRKDLKGIRVIAIKKNKTRVQVKLNEARGELKEGSVFTTSPELLEEII